MSYLTRSSYATPRNLCELLLRDVASLLATSQLVGRSLYTLRPECAFSPELTETLDSIVTTSKAGESHLHQPLVEAGAVLPPASDAAANALVTGLFTRLPAALAPGVLAAEIAVNLRLLAQHIELKARLAAEEALLVGQNKLCQALIAWAAEWRACGEVLRSATVRARAQAYVADLGQIPAAKGT